MGRATSLQHLHDAQFYDAAFAQIARRCGYPEVRPFITAFRRRHGQPPGAFRAHGGTLHL